MHVVLMSGVDGRSSHAAWLVRGVGWTTGRPDNAVSPRSREGHTVPHEEIEPQPPQLHIRLNDALLVPPPAFAWLAPDSCAGWLNGCV